MIALFEFALSGLFGVKSKPSKRIGGLNGAVSEIRYSAVAGRAPLDIKEMRYFEEIVSARADDIIAKWIDFFVLHKPITSERITRRLK